MISARVKDFLLNLLIAIVLSIPILASLFYFKDKIKNIFVQKPSLKINGIYATLKTEEKEYNTLLGKVKEKGNGNKLLIENEGEEKWVEIDPEEIAINTSKEQGVKALKLIEFSQIKPGDRINIYDFEGKKKGVLRAGRVVIWRVNE